MSSGLTEPGVVFSSLGSSSDLDTSASSVGPVESTFLGMFLVARSSSELRPCVRLLSVLQPLRENHLSAKRPYTPFFCMTSSATLDLLSAGPLWPVTGSLTSVGACAASSTSESVTLGASSSLSLSVSSSPVPRALLCRCRCSRVEVIALSASDCDARGTKTTSVILYMGLPLICATCSRPHIDIRKTEVATLRSPGIRCQSLFIRA